MSINALLNNSKKVIIFGTTYGNRAEACRQLGVNSSSVEERMRNRNTNLEETVQHF